MEQERLFLTISKNSFLLYVLSKNFTFISSWLSSNCEIETITPEETPDFPISTRGFSLDGKRFSSRTIIGKVEAKDIIWVWKGYGTKISESALAHELVHLALMAKHGSPDADHEGHKYRGWTPAHSAMIVSAKRMMRAFNL